MLWFHYLIVIVVVALSVYSTMKAFMFLAAGIVRVKQGQDTKEVTVLFSTALGITSFSWGGTVALILFFTRL